MVMNQPPAEEASEYGTQDASNSPTTNLIINFLPLDFKEGQLRALFQEIGQISSVRIMKNRRTSQSKGYGFVKFAGHEDAKRAIAKFNGKNIQGKQIKVAFSRPGGTRTHCNLFVSNLPKKWSNVDLAKHFEQYGSLLECRVLKNLNGDSRRCGFVRFDAPIDAQRALKSMDGYLPKNARSSINVKLAERPSHDKKKSEMKHFDIFGTPTHVQNDNAFYRGAGGDVSSAGSVPPPPSAQVFNPYDIGRMYPTDRVPQVPSELDQRIRMKPGHAPHPLTTPSVGPQTRAANINAINRMFMNTQLYSRPVAMTPPPMTPGHPHAYLATSPTPGNPYIATSPTPNVAAYMGATQAAIHRNAAAFSSYPGFQTKLLEPGFMHPDYSLPTPTPDLYTAVPAPNDMTYANIPKGFGGEAYGEEFAEGPGPVHRFKNMSTMDTFVLSTPSPPPGRQQVSSQNLRMHMKNDVRPSASLPPPVAPLEAMGAKNIIVPITPLLPQGVGKDTIFLSNLPSIFAEDKIRAVCAPYGKVKMVTLQRDNMGSSLGMAFVSYVNPMDADMAVHRLNGTMMYDSKVMVRR